MVVDPRQDRVPEAQLNSVAANARSAKIEVILWSIEYAAAGTLIYELRRADGEALPQADAGAHIDLQLPHGLTRQYSLLDPAEEPRRYRVAVKREVESRGGSRYLHEECRVGKRLTIGMPRNNFPLQENAEYSVLIAGGIGITPIRSMLRRLEQLQRPWELHYSCRSRAEAAFLAELQGLAGRVHWNFDEESGAVLDLPTIVAGAPPQAHFYCCGPRPMLRAFESATGSIAAERVHIESFVAEQPAAVSGGYTVELARSKLELHVPPGKTILDVVLEAGVAAESSCRQGLCGSCETAVLAGVPDHRDSVLSTAERSANKTMMICCSACVGERLVLDL